MDPKQLWYTLDHRNVISGVYPGWDAFARRNGGGDGALARHVIGRKLWDFMSPGAVTDIYRNAIECARQIGVFGSIPYVCNSPTSVRHVEFSATVLPNGLVLVTNTIFSMSPRSMHPRFKFWGEEERGLQCSFCEAYIYEKTSLYTECGRRLELGGKTPLKDVCRACEDRIGRPNRTAALFNRKKANINFPPA